MIVRSEPTIPSRQTTMAPFRSCLWLAMLPTAFLSLASLLTYLVFRIYYLSTAEPAESDPSNDELRAPRLRTVALPWVFFGLEFIILSMLITRQRASRLD